MLNSPEGEDTSSEEPVDATPLGSADEQEQDGPRGHGGEDPLKHTRDAMDEHTKPSSLSA